MKDHVQIAIDGPVAAGKGTVARLLAERLGILYVDTGAMYRVVALLGMRHEVRGDEVDGLVRLIREANIQMSNPEGDERDGRLTTVKLNGEDVSWAIRTEEMGKGASKVATIKEVRRELVDKQQEIARSQSVVMEGRDITYRVLPEADLKVFLTADEEVRARRRYEQYLKKGEDVSLEVIREDLRKRDKQDSEREADPLKIVKGAWVFDTSDMSIEEVVDELEKRVKQLEG